MNRAMNPPARTETVPLRELDDEGFAERYGCARFTATVGYNRGGAGMIKDVLWVQAGEHYTIPMRYRRPSGIGVHGGQDGAAGAIWWFSDQEERRKGLLGISGEVYAAATPIAGNVDPETNAPDAGGEYAYFGRVPIWQTDPMAMWRYKTNGGGGWGEPLEREPERVMRDVRDGYVSIEGALRDFGVVVEGDPERHPEKLEIDADATARARAERA